MGIDFVLAGQGCSAIKRCPLSDVGALEHQLSEHLALNTVTSAIYDPAIVSAIQAVLCSCNSVPD